MQVSTSAPKFDPGGCADPSYPQSQEGGQNFTPFLLWLFDLITFCRVVFRNASPVLVAVSGAQRWGSTIASTDRARRGASG